jgi:two-component system LytT family response regulator
MKLNTLIIDDEPLACLLLKDMLKDYEEINIIGTCHNGYEGLEAINNLKPDLIFLDIQMPKITGIEMLELVEEKPYVIFSTAYDEYAVKAFEFNAIDYLLKPYDQSRVEKAISNLKSRVQIPKAAAELNLTTKESVERIVVKEHGDIKIIPIQQITHIEALGDYIKIYTDKKFHIKHGKISHYDDLLKDVGFIRNHRSYLINIKYLAKIKNNNNSYSAILKNEIELPISKSGHEIIKKVIN